MPCNDLQCPTVIVLRAVRRRLRDKLSPRDLVEFLPDQVPAARQPARGLLNLLNPPAGWILGADINRPVEKDIVQAGFRIERLHPFAGGLFEMIEAQQLEEWAGRRRWA